ncbi:MAG: M23 family metallopeptidase [Pseudomonadota bacterium]|nr:M23 family metallopeptidase [Pseudomonadota bacterium]
MKRSTFAVVLGFLVLAFALPLGAGEFRLDGDFIQGGLVRGWAPPGAAITLDGRKLRLSPEGLFIFGFGRDAAREAVLVVSYPGGEQETRNLSIAAREYRIQRIDGLPKKMVTPPPELLARIREEDAKVREARAFDTAELDLFVPFAWPAQGPISGVYGSQRILNGEPRQPHFGVDIAASTGTPVRTPAGGEIRLAEPDLYYSGGTVILDHGHGLSSSFLHMSRVDVAVGQRVAQGEVIGAIGATGRVTGAHLDWRMNWFERRLDPALLVEPQK